MVVNGKEVIVFHRPPRNANRDYRRPGKPAIPEGVSEQVEEETPETKEHRERERQDNLRRSNAYVPESFKLIPRGKSLVCEYVISYGLDKIKNKFEITTVPGDYIDFFYNQNLGQTVFKNLMAVNPYASQMNYEFKEGFYFGKYLVTDRTILIYLRGAMKDIPGVRNVVMKDNQNSVRAFQAYSSVANRMILRQHAKRTFLSTTDPLDSVGYLEAQVDMLTRIILDKGLADGNAFKPILETADKFAIYRYNKQDMLLAKMQEKKRFRDKQLAYYKAIKKLS